MRRSIRQGRDTAPELVLEGIRTHSIFMHTCAGYRPARHAGSPVFFLWHVTRLHGHHSVRDPSRRQIMQRGERRSREGAAGMSSSSSFTR
jgi:hypothetical protein